MSGADVLVAGGGLAGAATALSLLAHRPELRVTIVERSEYRRPRIGETLPAQAAIPLRRLGVWDGFARQGHLPAAGTCAAWGSDRLHANEAPFSAYGPGWHVDRAAFDGWLAGRAEARGARLLTGTPVRRVRRCGSGWEVDAGDGTVRAAVVVDATGRRAAIARSAGAQRVHDDHLVGSCLFFSGGTDRTTVVEAQQDGWWYSATVPGDRIVAAFMTDADIARRRRLRERTALLGALAASRHTRRRLAGAAPRGRPAVQLAASQRLDRAAGPGWVAVGDAASTLDPLSSLGMFKALRSGILGSYAVLDWLRGDERGIAAYQRAHDAGYRAYLSRRAGHYAEERRWPDSPFWQRRRAGAGQNNRSMSLSMPRSSS